MALKKADTVIIYLLVSSLLVLFRKSSDSVGPRCSSIRTENVATRRRDVTLLSPDSNRDNLVVIMRALRRSR